MMADEPKQPQPEAQNNPDDFSREAEQEQIGFVREFVDFLLHNKKWWLIPIVVVLLVVAVGIAIGGGAASPFIYTFF
jgi:hypothetical protein